MVKTQTDKQRISQLEKEVAEIKKENAKLRKGLKKVKRELREDDVQLPPDLTPEEREQQELADRYHRIGF